jgi:hypothetical protein
VDPVCCRQVELEIRPACAFVQRRRVVLNTGSGVDGEARRLCADACPHRDLWRERVLVDSASQYRPLLPSTVCEGTAGGVGEGNVVVVSVTGVTGPRIGWKKVEEEYWLDTHKAATARGENETAGPTFMSRSCTSPNDPVWGVWQWRCRER